MRDACDVVIIGAGHNGLTLGAYLARSGVDVVVLERRHEEGGGLCTEELTRPGFLHNVHANYHTFVDMAPPVRDLEVREHGVEYVRPEVQMASIFDDGTALCVHDRPGPDLRLDGPLLRAGRRDVPAPLLRGPRLRGPPARHSHVPAARSR